MFSIGLTGNIAAGKSTVARWFGEWGATVIDADQIVHDLQQPGTPVFDAICEHFGTSILASDGTINRTILRGLVLDDPQERATLNQIVHPAVRERRRVLVANARDRGDALVVSDIPLLFETGQADAFDLVVLVDAPTVIRKERLIRDRGLPGPEADRLIAAQMPASEKRPHSDLIIENDGDVTALHRATYQAWTSILAQAQSSA